MIGSDAPVNLHAIIELEMQIFERIGAAYTLGFSRTVSYYDECGFGEDAKPINPASKNDFLINELTEGMNQRALVERGFHSGKSLIQKISAGTTNPIAAVPSSFRPKSALDSRRFVA